MYTSHTDTKHTALRHKFRLMRDLMHTYVQRPRRSHCSSARHSTSTAQAGEDAGSAPLPAAQRTLRGLLAGAALAAGEGPGQRPALQCQRRPRWCREALFMYAYNGTAESEAALAGVFCEHPPL